VEFPVDDSVSPLINAGPAERRRAELTEIPLFQPSGLRERSVRYSSRVFDIWEPTELGHSVLFRLRQQRAKGADSPFLTASALAVALEARLDRQHPAYDERLAWAVQSMEVRSPWELLVRFQQVPLRPEALFAFAPEAGSKPATSETGHPAGGTTPAAKPVSFPFSGSVVDGRNAIYRREIDAAVPPASLSVSEVIEIRFDSYERALQALLRGELSYLPDPPPWMAKALAERSEFSVIRRAVPVTHYLQFNPRSRPLRSRAFRRALVYALDRQRLLEELYLHEPPGPLGRLTSGVVPSRSYACDRSIEPHSFDPALAWSLVRTAAKELDGPASSLQMAAPADPLLRRAAARLRPPTNGMSSIALTASVSRSCSSGHCWP
jgi:hypothetical protein